MKLSDIKGEEALDVVAELLDPITAMGMKDEIKKADRKDKIGFIKIILKSCKKEIIEILAILDRTPVEEYEVSLLSLPSKVMELFNDPSVQELFGWQSQAEQTSSGSVTETTEVAKK